MRTLQLLSLVCIVAALPSTAQAQFSVSGGGSAIPASGLGGGTWDVAQPVAPGVGTVVVPEAVETIDSVVIEGFTHTWAGDVQATLTDPTGTEHTLFVRPGFQNPESSNWGTPGDFLLGTFTIVESGGSSLPTVSDGVNIPAGTYNQTFDTGGTVWNSGTNNISNTPLGQITGSAGTWELRIYDWGIGDNGNFTGWTLNGNTPPETGGGYCFGDGTGADCACGGFGGPGEGCMNTSGSGAALVGTGEAVISNDTFFLSVSGGPANKPGIFFQGVNQVANPLAEGILCTLPTKRYGLNILDGTGSAVQRGFGAFATQGGSMNYQYWFRDTGNTCGAGGFNLSNGWEQLWE